MKRLDRCILFALSAAKEALGDAGIDGYQPDRVGVVLGSGIGGFHELIRQYNVLREHGPGRVSPGFLPNVLADAASGRIAIALGIRGPNFAVVSACATGSHAIGVGAAGPGASAVDPLLRERPPARPPLVEKQPARGAARVPNELGRGVSDEAA